MSHLVISAEENEEKILSADREISRETGKERALSPLVLNKKSDHRTNIVAAIDVNKVEQKLEEMQNTLDSVIEYELEQQFEQSALVSGNVSKSKQKQTSTQRMKLKEHNIIAKDKATVRLPSDYKFDRSTTLILQMLKEQRHSGEFHNVVGTGTYSIVIHAHCYRTYHIYFPCGNAIKVYKLSNNLEKNKAIYKTVQRENEHLQILREQHFSNNTPHPVQKNKNVIMMSFIGSDQETAPSITVLPSEILNGIYCEIVKEIESWYKKLGLIHGNFTARNVLYWMDKLYFIGWSHSVRKNHPLALKKLMKDCLFVTTFFQCRGIPVKNVEDLFKAITGLDKISSKVLGVVNKDFWRDPNRTNPNRTSVAISKPTHNRFK